jgi:hypothetical protein
LLLISPCLGITYTKVSYSQPADEDRASRDPKISRDGNWVGF